MNAGFGRRWSAREDAIVRARYVSEGAAALARELDRTLFAVHHRAVKLGTLARRPWTAADDRRLELLWGLFTTRQIAQRLGRSTAAIYVRATVLGTVKKERSDKESLSDSARRTGFTRQQLAPILQAAGVLRVATSRCLARYKLRPSYLLDPDEVDQAIAAWVARENLTCAAKRRGVEPRSLVVALRRIGITRPANLAKRRQWRIDDETVERALRARAAA